MPAVFYAILTKILFDNHIITFRVISKSHVMYSNNFVFAINAIFVILFAVYVKKRIAKKK